MSRETATQVKVNLPRSNGHLQRPEETPDRVPLFTGSLVIASTNRRRVSFIRHCFPGAYVMAVSAGEEKEGDDEREIARGKIDQVSSQISTGLLCNISSPLGIIASDTRKTILTTSGLESKGKPENEQEIRLNLEEMLNASNKTGLPPLFLITSGSALVLDKDSDQYRGGERLSSLITLRKEALERLVRDDGFAAYLNEFYAQEFPDSDGAPLDIKGSTAGLDIRTLMRIGAIEAVDDVPSANTPAFRRALKKALYISKAGFSYEDLERLGMTENEVNEAIGSWPTLDLMVEQVFEQRVKPTLTVVIPVKDDDYTPILFDSLRHTRGFENVELIIVRNGSPSRQVIVATDAFAHENSNTRVIETERGGIPYARNLGYRVANGRYVINLDSDVQVGRSFIEVINEIVTNESDTDIIVPLLLRDEGETLLQKLTSRHFTLLSRRDPPPVHNPGLVLNKEKFGEEGPFDESLRFTDSDFAHRTNGNRKKVFTRKAVVFHRADPPEKTLRQHGNYGQAKSVFSRKHPNEVRRQIARQKAKELAFIPRAWQYKNLGVFMAAFEGLLGFWGAKEFWREEARSLLKGQNY